ncbi:PepSY domain-containing protein [Motilimonas pumila]|uniref:PepSY domain-containing protein n=1 Tax=Motilimonas pumila TaxID=2303987 RepID=A0A418YBR5_9GAMM|nr:PepSY domain-containing protein [Motilimonas pumila]RJG41876.1 hypothetical protein D1Z90_16050 [Motilimonas pumila]
MKKQLKAGAIRWHGKWAWLAFAALIIWAASGLLHPLLSWTGPKLAKFFPPSAKASAQQINQIPVILAKQQIEQALLVKLMPTQQGMTLQITESADQPRRYFDLSSGEEMPNYDRQQAKWLASYYTGRPEQEVLSTELITAFNDDYPWVNRLLPVYQVKFVGDDGLRVFVYTETNAQAGISNHYKARVQSWFRALHTWNWLQQLEYARVVIIALMMLALLAMTVTGISMLVMLKRSKKAPWQNTAHHWLAYIVCLPLLFFSFSGLYHLLQYATGDNVRGMRMAKPLTWDNQGLLASPVAEHASQQLALNGVSLLRDDQGQLMYRLNLAKSRDNSAKKGGHHHHHGKHQEQATAPSRQAIYDGIVVSDPAVYISAENGKQMPFNDKALAIALAQQHLGLSADKLSEAKLITRFGMHYDFRNKRLPVWQLSYDTPEGDWVFVDPATGILVDRLNNQARFEGYSFSFLHKWNFLRPIMERTSRDIVMSVTLAVAMMFALFGVVIKLKRRKRRRRV